MEISDLLISTVRDIRLSLLSGSDDSVEPSIAALTKDVNKHPDFEGQKISQAMLSAVRRSAPKDNDQRVARAHLRIEGVTTRPSLKVPWLLSTEGHTSASYFARIVCGASLNEEGPSRE